MLTALTPRAFALEDSPVLKSAKSHYAKGEYELCLNQLKVFSESNLNQKSPELQKAIDEQKTLCSDAQKLVADPVKKKNRRMEIKTH